MSVDACIYEGKVGGPSWLEHDLTHRLVYTNIYVNNSEEIVTKLVLLIQNDICIVNIFI